MNKLKYLIKYGVRKRVMSKAFLIANAVIGVIIIGLMLMPTILSSFGNDLISLDDKVVIVNTTGYDQDDKDFTNYLTSYINAYIVNMTMIDNVDYTLSNNEEDVPASDYYNQEHEEAGVIYIYKELISPDLDPSDVNNYIIKTKIYNVSLSEVFIQAITNGLRELNRVKYMLDNNVDNALIVDLIPEFVVDENINEDNQMGSVFSAIAPIVILPIFILITFAVQAIGLEIIDEKSSKAIEIIIASVKPTTHFIGKILSIIIFQVIQMGCFLVFGVIGLVLNMIVSGATSGDNQSWNALLGEFAPMVLPVLSLVIVCAILGATLYAILGAFIGSISLNPEDYQQTQTPLMLIMTVAYLGSMFAGISNATGLLYAFTYIPFFAPLSIPVTYIMGYITITEALLGILITAGSVVGAACLIAPLYKASILSYDQSNLFKRMKNAYKNAKALKQNKKLYEGNNSDESK